MPGGAETQGLDLLPALIRGRPLPERTRYCESRVSELGFGMAPLYGIMHHGDKWIRAPRPERFRLDADPHELNNLAGRDTRTDRQLDRYLDAILADCRRRAVVSSTSPLDRETEETLRSLGYLANQASRNAMGGMDPKDGIGYYNQLEEARHQAQAGRWAQAEQVLRTILATLPRHVAARNVLAICLLRQGRDGEAAAEYLRSLADDPSQARVCLALGNLRLISDDLRGAERFFRQALAITPGFVEAMSNLGVVALLRGNEAEARAWYNRAVATDPGFPGVYRRLGDLCYDRGEFGRAHGFYRQALDRQPQDFRATIQLGNCARRLGDPAGAEAAFRQAARLHPGSWIPAYNLACLKAVLRQPGEARRQLKAAVQQGLFAPRLLAQDPDLASLRGTPFFDRLLARMRPGEESEADESVP